MKKIHFFKIKSHETKVLKIPAKCAVGDYGIICSHASLEWIEELLTVYNSCRNFWGEI